MDYILGLSINPLADPLYSIRSLYGLYGVAKIKIGYSGTRSGIGYSRLYQQSAGA